MNSLITQMYTLLVCGRKVTGENEGRRGGGEEDEGKEAKICNSS
jgi:hypothetical protein